MHQANDRAWFPWNGSKRWLLSELTTCFRAWRPHTTARFFDPFCGSGAVSQRVRELLPITQVIGDANPWLAALLAAQQHATPVCVPADFMDFDRWRSYTDDDYAHLSADERAQRFAVCLHTAWGHRWKTDASGKFTASSAPLDPKFCEPTKLKQQLERVFQRRWLTDQDVVVAGDWRQTIASYAYGDLVYFDPPYPETLGYGTQTWTISDLLDVIDWLADRQIAAVFSNVADVERLLTRIGFQTALITSPTASRTRKQRREVLAWRF